VCRTVEFTGGARTWSDARCPSGGGVSRSYALIPGVGVGAIRPSAISTSRASSCPCSRGVDEIYGSQVFDQRLRIGERSQRVEALGRIVAVVGLEQRVETIPVALELAVDETESGGESRDAFGP
jgi:hypothetical protein